jgi:hypothetical protein
MNDHRFTEPARMTFMESMRSLLNTARQTIQAGPQGISSPALYESRLRICEACPKRQAVGPIWKCGVCNCLLHLKAGTTVAVCPWFKWPGDEKYKPRDFHPNL